MERFYSPYQEMHASLQDRQEQVVSLTTTHIPPKAPFDRQHRNSISDPEIAGGKDFSGDGTGSPTRQNSEAPRDVASARLKPYLARLYVSYDFGFKGTGKNTSRATPNPKPRGTVPWPRYTIALGRFTGQRFFDNSQFTHDPRTADSMELGRDVRNGSLGLSADTRSYTLGMGSPEFHAPQLVGALQ